MSPVEKFTEAVREAYNQNLSSDEMVEIVDQFDPHSNGED